MELDRLVGSMYAIEAFRIVNGVVSVLSGFRPVYLRVARRCLFNRVIPQTLSSEIGV